MVDPIREAVAELRELPWKRHVAVLVGDSPTFDALLGARGVRPHRLMVGVFVDDSIWLRKTASENEVTETIAHELVHALERQHGLLGAEREEPAEARLARRALHEGVALAVGRAAVGKLTGSHAPRRMLAELGSELEELSLTSLLSSHDDGTFEDRFPYAVGGGFSGALYNTGGAALWDLAERAPPTLLVHVLRPSLYLAGYTEPVAALLEPTGGNPVERQARGSWIAQSILGDAAPLHTARWMDDLRGIELLRRGNDQAFVFAFGSSKTPLEITRILHDYRRVGPNHILGRALPVHGWKTTLPPAGTPPHPQWPRPADVLHPYDRDPVLAFTSSGGRTTSTGLGLSWRGVRHAGHKGRGRSEIRFDDDPAAHDPRAALVSTMLLRLPEHLPVENGLSLLVQTFVSNEVAALQVHDGPSIETPAGRVYVRRIETPEEPVTVALLPRCNERYALAFVVFERELSFAGFRHHLAGLHQDRPDLETRTCVRATRESLADFTPTAPPG